MFGKLSAKLLPIIRRLTSELNSVSDAFKWNVKREYGKSSAYLHSETNSALLVDEELREIFKFRNTKISNWIIEVSPTTNYVFFYARNLLSVKSISRNICRTKHAHYASDILKAIRRIASEFCAYWLRNTLCNTTIYAK